MSNSSAQSGNRPASASSGKPPAKGPSPKQKAPGSVGSVLRTVGRFFATVFMVGVITGCMVACVLTVYILRYIGSDDEISLESVKLGYTSIIYASDPDTGEEIELQRLYYGGENRIWIDYDQMNQYTKDAIVAVEDKRFWTHNGVDWQRTAGAFVNMFIPIYNTRAGGSTITQQLIKNITNDDDIRVERKVREIFRALNLAKNYSREQVLEAYLNVLPLGNGTNGIQSAANVYFEKDAIDLTLAESAALVGITQYPGRYDPFVNPENNKERQEHILSEMLDQELITEAEYSQAVSEELEWKGTRHFESIQSMQSYFEDYVVEKVIEDLMEQKGYTRNYASEQLYMGGLRIYTTVDLGIQAHLEEIYSSSENMPPLYNAEYPQSAAVITDPNGKILAMVGGIGEKEGSRVLNRATSQRQPGSAIKPIATYALAFEYDRITWSTMMTDQPITLPGDASTAPRTWPRNHYGSYDGNMTVLIAIQRSTNTIPAQLAEMLTPRRVFDFLKNDLQFDSLVERVVVDGGVKSDVTLSAMAIGGTTFGVTPIEMAGGFQIYANGGTFTKPYAYTEVLDSSGKTVLSSDRGERQVISPETSVVVNRLLQKVVTDIPGTGRAANLGFMPTAGKTGTSTDDVDQWFVGMTPYYVCSIWLGFDYPNYIDENGYTRVNSIRYGDYPPPILFRQIMSPLHEGLEYKQFPDSSSVVSMEYCTITGDLAGANCGSRASGWYKTSRLPNTCSGNHGSPVTEGGDGDSGGGSSPDSGSESDAGSGNTAGSESGGGRIPGFDDLVN